MSFSSPLRDLQRQWLDFRSFYSFTVIPNLFRDLRDPEINSG